MKQGPKAPVRQFTFRFPNTLYVDDVGSELSLAILFKAKAGGKLTVS